MKLAILSKTSQLVGGVETYLRELLPALREYGFEILEWYEDRSGQSIDDIRAFSPDLLFVHGIESAATEKAALDLAPAVFFAHNYDSTCVSGFKRWKRPAFVPCQRALDVGCLAHYLVNGCGGRNPMTMARDYARRAAHRTELHRYRAIVTHSAWMQAEFTKNTDGKVPVHRIPFLVDVPDGPGDGVPPESTWRVGFLGRHTSLKGGDVLVAAAARLSHLARPLEVWFMGEGPERAAWEQSAQAVASDRVRFRFWNHGDNPRAFLSQIHLLAVPSLWPEPFGRVGVEAAACGVPSVAFAVGGIPDWLKHLENGVQVPLSGDPAKSLAHGIETALEGGNYAGLARTARETPRRYTKACHLAALIPLLENSLTR